MLIYYVYGSVIPLPISKDNDITGIHSQMTYSKLLSVISSKHLNTRNIKERGKRQLDPTSAQTLQQYWLWKNSNRSGSIQLRHGRSIDDNAKSHHESQNRKILFHRSKKSSLSWNNMSTRWNYHKLMKLIRKFYKRKRHRKNGKFQLRFG